MEARIIKLVECIESNKSIELSQIAAFQLGQLAKENSSGILERISPLLFHKSLDIQQSAALALSEILFNMTFECNLPETPITFAMLVGSRETAVKRFKPSQSAFSNILNILRQQIFEDNWEAKHGSLLGFRVVMKTKKICKECEEDTLCRVILAISQDQTADYSSDLPQFPIRKLGAEIISLSSTAVSVYLEQVLLTFWEKNTLAILLCFRKGKIFTENAYKAIIQLLRISENEDVISEALHYLAVFPLVKDQGLTDLTLSLIDKSDSLSSFIKYAIKIIDKLFNLNCDLPQNYSKIYALFTHTLTEVRYCTFSAFINLVHRSCLDVSTVFLLTTQGLLLETNQEILAKAKVLSKYLINTYDLLNLINEKLSGWNRFVLQLEPKEFDFFVVPDKSVSAEELYSFADNNTEEDIKSSSYLAKKKLERMWRIGKLIGEASKLYKEQLLTNGCDRFLRILSCQSIESSEIHEVISTETEGKIENIRIRAVAVYKLVKLSLTHNLQLPEKISNILQAIVTAYKHETHSFFKLKLAKSAARLAVLLKTRNCNEKFLLNLIKLSPFPILKTIQEVHQSDTPKILSIYQDFSPSNLILITQYIHPSLNSHFASILPLLFKMLPSKEVIISLTSIFSQVSSSIPYLIQHLLTYLKQFPLPFDDPLIILKGLLKNHIVSLIPFAACLMLPLLSHLNTASGSVVAEVFSEILYAVMLDSPDSVVPEELMEEKRSGMEFLANLKGVYTLPKYVPRVNLHGIVLRDYQKEGIAWMRFLAKFRLGGMLCDEMGLGKTIQSLCAIAEAHIDHKNRISLIICPASIVGHWVKEAKNYLELNVSEGFTENFKSGIMVVPYSSLSSLLRLSCYNFLYIILDEGHLLSNPKTKTYKLVKNLHSEYRLILTGTPIQNKILELWPFFDFLMPGFLGTQTDFSVTYQRYLKPKKAERTVKFKDEYLALQKLNTLHKKILPFVLRRLKKDILHDLPEKIIQDYYIELNPCQKLLLEEFYNKGSHSQLDEYNYLRKLCNHPLLIDDSLESAESPKIEALKDLLNDCEICEESGTAHKALIFTKMKKMLDIIEREILAKCFPLTQYLRLDGSTPLNKRFEVCEDFNTIPQYRLMLMTTDAGGLGLNLQAADVVIFVDHSWNPIKDLQAMDRTHRIGQKNVVNVYRLITRNTLEEEILGLQAFKTKISEALVNAENSSMEKVDSAALLNSVIN